MTKEDTSDGTVSCGTYSRYLFHGVTSISMICFFVVLVGAIVSFLNVLTGRAKKGSLVVFNEYGYGLL